MKNKLIKNYGWVLVLCSLILLTIGLVALFSATHDNGNQELKKQIIWFIVSIPVLVIVALLDYESIIQKVPWITWVFYGIFVLLLILVLFTQEVNGARSWFKLNENLKFQPSEIAKIVLIISLAKMIVNIQKESKDDVNKFSSLLKIGILVGIPLVLILLEPDIGTAMAFIFAIVFMLILSGIRKRYILLATILVIIAMPLSYKYLLPEHAKTRIDVFLNPNLDPRGAGYNVIQSKLAIGSGQLLGMGLLKGNQTQLGFLYPKTTDFIFSVIGEEMGFVVAALVIITYVIMIIVAIDISKNAPTDFDAYVAIGIVGIFVFHMLENIGMTMGLLPITGVPLPFVSYGGSSLLMNFISIGILLNINKRKRKVMFK